MSTICLRFGSAASGGWCAWIARRVDCRPVLLLSLTGTRSRLRTVGGAPRFVEQVPRYGCRDLRDQTQLMANGITPCRPPPSRWPTSGGPPRFVEQVPRYAVVWISIHTHKQPRRALRPRGNANVCRVEQVPRYGCRELRDRTQLMANGMTPCRCPTRGAPLDQVNLVIDGISFGMRLGAGAGRRAQRLPSPEELAPSLRMSSPAVAAAVRPARPRGSGRRLLPRSV